MKLECVPNVLVDCFEYIVRNGLATEGIFRKEGSATRVRALYVRCLFFIPTLCTLSLQQYLLAGNDLRRYKNGNYSVIDVTTVVKRLLREIEPPLLTDMQVCTMMVLYRFTSSLICRTKF